MDSLHSNLEMWLVCARFPTWVARKSPSLNWIIWRCNISSPHSRGARKDLEHLHRQNPKYQQSNSWSDGEISNAKNKALEQSHFHLASLWALVSHVVKLDTFNTTAPLQHHHQKQLVVVLLLTVLLLSLNLYCNELYSGPMHLTTFSLGRCRISMDVPDLYISNRRHHNHHWSTVSAFSCHCWIPAAFEQVRIMHYTK